MGNELVTLEVQGAGEEYRFEQPCTWFLNKGLGEDAVIEETEVTVINTEFYYVESQGLCQKTGQRRG